MENHSNDKPIREEIINRSEKARELFQRSQALLEESRKLKRDGENTREQNSIREKSVQMLKAAIAETDEICRLQKTLLDCQVQKIQQ